MEDIPFETDFVEYDSIYISKINCGKYICDLEHDEAKYTQIAYQIASYFAAI